ncbi:MAG: uroporphyrinogen decarboxylase family protein [Chloroflexota bacterium]
MAATMTSRERVLTALSHKEPDRVPMDLGASRCTSIHVNGHDRLRRHFDLAGGEDILTDKIMRPVVVDERILQRLQIDTRGLFIGFAENSRDAQLTPTRWRDEWGVEREMPGESLYYDLVRSPLAGEVTIQDVVNYPWPDPDDPGRYRGLVERAKALRASTDCAIVFNMASGFVHTAQYLRGFQDWFTDLLLDPKLAVTLMDIICDINCAIIAKAIPLVRDYVDIMFTGDDIGHHNSPLVSPELYRKLIKPGHKRYFDLVHSLSDAKVLYHTCGDVYPLVGDLIDMGIDALNPVQVTAKDMDPVRLKAEFGDKMAFWGGIDTQHVLPFGTPDEVKREVQLRIDQMAPGGGYVLNAVHNIQPDVSPENIVAMYDHGRAYGQYPLPK